MSKPRFPLSVTRNFYYRASIESTGETLDCNNFKTLFRCVRSHLRTEVLYHEKGFKSCDAVLEFGFETCYEITPGRCYTEWTRIDYYGFMYVSTLSETFYRAGDANIYVMRGA